MASLRNGSFDGFITNTIVPKYQLWLKMMKFNNFKFFIGLFFWKTVSKLLPKLKFWEKEFMKSLFLYLKIDVFTDRERLRLLK